jgi:hypothetical protein
VSGTVELQKDGLHRTGPAVVLVLHFDFSEIDVDFSRERGSSRRR